MRLLFAVIEQDRVLWFPEACLNAAPYENQCASTDRRFSEYSGLTFGEIGIDYRRNNEA